MFKALIIAVLASAALADAPVALRRAPLLFADDSGLLSSSRVVRTVHAANTLEQPVITADQPWEGQRVYVYGSVYAEPDGSLNLWYMSRGVGKSDQVLLATSTDGLQWTKPQLDGAGNNIVYHLHSPTVLRDAFEKEPARRYKMLGSGKGGYHAAVSPDGLHWSPLSDKPVLAFGDTITLSQDVRGGEYLAFHKRPSKEHGRCVWLARSSDFITWSEPTLVFAADEFDDSWVTQPGQRTEVYNMSVYPHAAGFLGLPAMFRVMAKTKDVQPGQSPHDGPIDIQLATSPDGVKWNRTWPRMNVIPRGKPGSFDGGAILGVSSTAVDVGDHTWVYYTGLSATHGAPMGPKKLTIGRAEWRRHGFVSLDADPAGCRIETRPLRLGGGTLLINADATRGELRVCLLEADGRPITGFTAAQSDVLRSDATQWPARWDSGTPIPQDRDVRIVVEFSGASLYSVQAR